MNGELESIATSRFGYYDTDLVADYIVDKIVNKGDNPLFLYASFNAPHDPWQVCTQHVHVVYDKRLIHKLHHAWQREGGKSNKKRA